jgi:hypothetical protein
VGVATDIKAYFAYFQKLLELQKGVPLKLIILGHPQAMTLHGGLGVTG